ncbi:Gfo/Idh/MocA family protein [Agromyces silvae]|uniref:Gfo/Idh/MocA family protein n=1 Tax=Agromyces silvae TaxID=3388266 RepID=UPI00280A4FC9|nr:Gfo/Idh/MocA family oxidoreductase [Agromyces protaetiae]
MSENGARPDLLRVAVVGVGRFGREHARRYARRTDCRLVAVVDPDVGLAGEVAREFECEAFADLAALLDARPDARPDAVSIVNPGWAHVETAERVLGAGIPALVEKPVALTADDGHRLIEAERASSAFVLPGHILRFSTAYRELRARVRSGEVGRPVGMSFTKHRTRDHDARYPDEHPVLLTGIHDIDMALWLTGEPVVSVRSTERHAPGRNQPVAVFSDLETESGIAIRLVNTWSPAEGAAVPDRVEIYGTDGMLQLDLTPRVTNPGSAPLDDEFTPASGGGALATEIDHFLERVRLGEPSDVITLEEAIDAIRVAERVVQAGAAG